MVEYILFKLHVHILTIPVRFATMHERSFKLCGLSMNGVNDGEWSSIVAPINKTELIEICFNTAEKDRSQIPSSLAALGDKHIMFVIETKVLGVISDQYGIPGQQELQQYDPQAPLSHLSQMGFSLQTP